LQHLDAEGFLVALAAVATETVDMIGPMSRF